MGRICGAETEKRAGCGTMKTGWGMGQMWGKASAWRTMGHTRDRAEVGVGYGARRGADKPPRHAMGHAVGQPWGTHLWIMLWAWR